MIETPTLLWEAGASDAPLPPLVELPDEQEDAHKEPRLVTLHRTYGPVFRLAQPGKEPRIILAGPAANVFMTRHEDEFFTTREHWEAFDQKISQERGAITEARDGEANRKRRAASSREWSRARVLDQIPRMIEIVQECTQNWQPGSTIGVHAAMRRLVAEQLGRLLLGTSPEDYLDDFIVYLNATITSTMRTEKSGGERFSPADFERAKQRVNEFGRKVYKAHLAHPQPNGKPDMIDDAIAQSEHYPEAAREMMLSMVALGPMLAGIDTVANSLSFLIYALLTHPEIRQRVQQEVDQALQDGPLTWEKLRGMPDLQGAMMETLRRYPVAQGHNARVAQPLTVGGYRLEPGDQVTVAMTVPHFLEELYPQPLQFDIERFRAPRNEHRKPGAYAPFGLGDHTCLGAGIAEVQMMVTIASLLHSYRFQLDPPNYQLVIERMPTAVPGNLHIQIVERLLA